MTLEPITEAIPEEHQAKLMENETAYHFAYIDKKGGCFSAQAAKQWILISNLRVIYEAAVKEAGGATAKYASTSGSIPISKISFVGSSTTQESGCSGGEVHLLKINSGGGQIEIAIPSGEEAKRLQNIIERLISK